MKLLHRLSISVPALCTAVLSVSSCGTMPGIHTMETVAYPAGLRETRQLVTGIAKFSGDEHWRFVKIEGLGTDKLGRMTWLPAAPDPARLDVSVPWSFELLVQGGGIRERLGWSEYQEIAKVIIQGETVFDASVCEVHRLQMERVIETKDDFAGRLMPRPFAKARRTEFPHSGTDFPACTFWENSTLTWRCPKCSAAARRWCRENASDAPLL